MTYMLCIICCLNYLFLMQENRYVCEMCTCIYIYMHIRLCVYFNSCEGQNSECLFCCQLPCGFCISTENSVKFGSQWSKRFKHLVCTSCSSSCIRTGAATRTSRAEQGLHSGGWGGVIKGIQCVMSKHVFHCVQVTARPRLQWPAGSASGGRTCALDILIASPHEPHHFRLKPSEKRRKSSFYLGKAKPMFLCSTIQQWGCCALPNDSNRWCYFYLNLKELNASARLQVTGVSFKRNWRLLLFFSIWQQRGGLSQKTSVV